MPPKKDGTGPETAIAGFDNKETRLLAAAFVSSTGLDKYDYQKFAQLTGFTEGTLKKFWPPVKKKTMEEHSNFAKFISGSATAAAPTSKVAAGKKRKASDVEVEAEDNASDAEPAADTANSKIAEGKVKKAPAKGKRGKKAKTEESEVEAEGTKSATVKDEDNSADGGDGLEEA